MSFFDRMFEPTKVVTRTVPIRPEWQVLCDRMLELSTERDRLKDEGAFLERKREALRRKLFVMIEDALECYEEFRLNTKTGMVEILGVPTPDPESTEDD